MNKHHLLKFGSVIKPKNSKKRKTSKKKKHAKGSIHEPKPSRWKTKGHSSEPVSEASSLKRKQKNMSSSPRNNNIENLMNQFLVMKNQNQHHDFIKKYGDNLTMPEFSKEQTSSILNISSQGGSNMSFINWNIRMNNLRPNSKMKNSKGHDRMEYSPKFPLKKGSTKVANPQWIDKRLISANSKNRKTQDRHISGINSNNVINADSQIQSNINAAYSLSDKNWQQENLVEKWRTHDERNPEVLNFYSSNQYRKPVVNTGAAIQKYVKMIPVKMINKSSYKKSESFGKSKNQNVKTSAGGPKMVISPNQINKHLKNERVLSLSPKSKSKSKNRDHSSSKQRL